MKNKYYDIMIAYRNALNVLEELTGIDTHSLKIYKKRKL
ncbi:MAG: hypothetical protein KatS3mg002_1616 [Candidatus Woesearchaeota archaeon]|nr:MAG: hypothetical protein KatS3mg002_1616 [Candidatus Woesearchaeota archaeon]